MERSRRQVVTLVVLMVLGVALVFGLIWREAREDRQRFAERCDVEALERRAPVLDGVALSDEALIALGGEAMAELLDACSTLDPKTRWMMRSTSYEWTPRVDMPAVVLDSRPTPARTLALREHTCGEGWDQVRQVGSLSGDQRWLFVFEVCELERFGLLDATDVAYVEPPWFGVWGYYQMLIDSGLSEPAARRYFLAIALASDIAENGASDLRIGATERWRRASVADPWTPSTSERAEVWTPSNDSSLCWPLHVSIDGDAPLERARSLLDPGPDLLTPKCATNRMIISVTERDELRRPLRAWLDFPFPKPAHAELELDVDASGRWRTEGASGDSPAQLVELLERRRPSSLDLRVAPAAPARLAVDLARAASHWRAAERSDMELWLGYPP